MKKLSLLLILVMLVSLIGVASPAPVAARPRPPRPPWPPQPPQPPCAVTVQGTAKMNSRTALVGNTVELWELNGTAAYKTTTTNSEGLYKFTGVPCGQYRVLILFLCKDNTVSGVSPIYNFPTSGIYTKDVQVNLSLCTTAWTPP